MHINHEETEHNRWWWMEQRIAVAIATIVGGVIRILCYSYCSTQQIPVEYWRRKKIKKILLEIGVELTSSGNHGVTKGIWNVLLYECNVSNDSGDTAPSIVNTPRANWLQTAMRWRKQANERTHIQFRCIHLLLLLLLLKVNEKKFRLNEKSMQFERKI